MSRVKTEIKKLHFHDFLFFIFSSVIIKSSHFPVSAPHFQNICCFPVFPASVDTLLEFNLNQICEVNPDLALANLNINELVDIDADNATKNS